MTRPRGTGSIRSRKGWLTIKYYVDGVPMREAVHSRNPAAAQALLNNGSEPKNGRKENA